jgi:hypothetical protein
VDVVGDVARRAGTPAGVVARTRGDREERRRDFEEERKTERMNPARTGRGTVSWPVPPTDEETTPGAAPLEPE